MMTDNKYFFDTALFIYALENASVPARSLFENANRTGRMVTSTISILEYCTGCYRNGRSELVDRFLSFLNDFGFEIVNIDREVSLEAARIYSWQVLYAPVAAYSIQMICNFYSSNARDSAFCLCSFTNEVVVGGSGGRGLWVASVSAPEVFSESHIERRTASLRSSHYVLEHQADATRSVSLRDSHAKHFIEPLKRFASSTKTCKQVFW